MFKASAPLTKKIVFSFWLIILMSLLGAKILNIFLNFSDQTNEFINNMVLLVSGIFYLWNAKETQRGMMRWTYAFAGVSLIVISFLEHSSTISIIGIICLIGPWLIQRFILKPETEQD